MKERAPREEFWTQKAWKKMSRNLFSHKDDAEVPYDASDGMAKVCREGGLRDEAQPQRTKKLIGKMRE